MYNHRTVMADIYENRRARLRQLIEERFDNNQLRLGAASGLRGEHIGFVLRGTCNLGEVGARRIEEALDLPDRWMDSEPPPGAVPKTPYKASMGKPPKIKTQAIKDLLAAGYSQRDTALQLGVHPSTVSRAAKREIKPKRPQRDAA